MKKFIAGIVLISFFFTSCEKKVEPVDGSNATVELFSSDPKAVTGDVIVNPKDSLIFSFTIASPKDMKYVSIQKNPVNQTAFIVRDTLTDANKNSYSITKRLRADSANGEYLYRIVAHDRGGVYIGHRDIRVTVTPDFNYFTYRFLYVPDTTAKINTCYMSATTGEVFSYSNGAANSSKIDFGFYYDTTGKGTSVTTDDVFFSLYSLNAAQPQLSFYDISSWTKNVTLMKKAAAPTFNTILSAGTLRAAAVTNLTTGATNKASLLSAASPNNLVFFKTSTGKAGCLQINFVNGSSQAATSYVNVDVKIEK